MRWVDGGRALLDLEEVACLLTYPKGIYDVGRIERLRSLGIEGVYSYGDTAIGGLRILGKGHSSVVVLARHRLLGDVALKIRRVDSKRDSLRGEGYLMSLVGYDVVPRVFYYDDDVIVMEYLDGVLLGDYVRSAAGLSESIEVFVRVFEVSYRLDMSGVDHLELTNPYRHVVVLRDGSVRVLDFESARVSERACNLCRVFSAFIKLHGVPSASLGRVRRLLREYKSGRRGVYADAVSALIAAYWASATPATVSRGSG